MENRGSEDVAILNGVLSAIPPAGASLKDISATTGLSTQKVLRAVSTMLADDVITRTGTPNKGIGVYHRRA